MPGTALGVSAAGDRVGTTTGRLESGQSVYDPLASLYKLGQVIDVPLERVGSGTRGRRRSPGTGEASLVGTAASHGESVLDRVSPRSDAGESIAMTGPTGEGEGSPRNGDSQADVKARSLDRAQALCYRSGEW